MNILLRATRTLAFIVSLSVTTTSLADVITDWNLAIRDMVVQSGTNTPVSNRTMAIVHTAMYAAANGVSQQYSASSDLAIESIDGASLDAAVASAARQTLLALIPSQQSSVEEHYKKALLTAGSGRTIKDGIRVGATAAERVLRLRENDGYAARENYRPETAVGRYVPTTVPAVPQWPSRKPWLLSSPDQFLPPPPPKLDSKQWSLDLNEVKRIGAANSTERTKEQTQIAKFWEATLPPIYHGVVHSVAIQPNRTVTENARLYAAVTRAIDDAMIAVFYAKYHFGLWRPITAIRNADQDGNERTERDSGWKPFIKTPMHPEYPCAHCVVAGTVGAVLKAEIGDRETPLLSTQSDKANGVTRTWNSIDEFVSEVAVARIYDGVHYRFSSNAGTTMGIRIGEQAADEYYAQH